MEGQVVTQGDNEPSVEWLTSSQNCGLQARFEDANLIDLIRAPCLGLTAWLRSHPDSIPTFIHALLPSVSFDPDEYALENYRQAMAWVRWAMLGAPEDVPRALDALLDTGSQGTGACGAQWGMDDIAYRCRDCELDPTCAVCVSCFLAGEHKDHDYQMIRTGGGCCDCGDPTAWRREGFCPNHQGPSVGRVELPEDFVRTATPVLKALLADWVERLDVASTALFEQDYMGKEDVVSAAEGMSTVVARELLGLCNRGEALLHFVGQLVGDKQLGLLSVLLSAGRALDTEAETEVHALLYKLLGDPDFKYSFAKVFLENYTLFAERRGYPPIHFAGFSVQVFTVPLLTARLVLEKDLLGILLATLRDTVRPAIGEMGRLEVPHYSIQTQQYSRILSDLKYVLSTPAVGGFAAEVRPELARSFVHFLAFAQGMLPHTRRTGTHIEMESEAWRDALMLETELGMLYRPFVEGAKHGRGPWEEVAGELLKREGEETVREKEVAGGSGQAEGAAAVPETEGTRTEGHSESRKGKEKVAQEEGNARAGTSALGDSDGLPEEEYKEKVMASLAEMTRAMADSALASPDFFAVMVGMLVEAGTPSQPGDPSLNVRKDEDRIAPDGFANSVPAPLTRLIAVCAGVLATWVEIDQVRESRRLAVGAAARDAAEEPGHSPGQLERLALARSRLARTARRSERDEGPGGLPGLGEVASLAAPVQAEPALKEEPVEWVALAESEQWPEVHFDVATQPVSFHLPLHRFLAQCFRGAVECTGRSSEGQFLRSLLPPKYRGSGFPAAVMEHVLQLQVLNAQIRAGMWRRNGAGVAHLAALYSNNYWCEDSRDLDVLLLQCCAVLAPPEDFVWRVVQRFGLEEYLAAGPLKHEYEPQLAEALLSLLVRISSERGLSGLDEKQLVRHELVQRLAREDATYSALSKALPPKLRESKHIKEALRGVATFIKPTGLEPGKFALKDKCWQELDPWAPSWDRAKLQDAEERFFRATGKSATFALLPKWTDPFPAFAGLSRVPTSGAVYDIVVAVLSRADEGRDGRVSDNGLYAALHLLALTLDTCQKGTGSVDRLPFVQKALEGVLGIVGGGPSSAGAKPGAKDRCLIELLVRLRGRFLQEEVRGDARKTEAAGMIKGFLRGLAAMHEALRRSILTLDPTFLSAKEEGKASGTGPPPEVEQRKLQARARQAAMLLRMKAAQAQFAATMSAGDDEGEREPEAATCVLCRAPPGESGASPLCHIVLGQRSRVVACARRPLPDWRAGIHTEGGPDGEGQYSRLGPIGWGAQGPPGGRDVMGPGGRMLVAFMEGQLWMDDGDVMDLDTHEENLEEDGLGAQQLDALWGDLIPIARAGEGVGALAQNANEGVGEEGAPGPNDWQVVLPGGTLGPVPTPFLVQAEGEMGPPGGPAESEDEQGDDWEMEESEDDDEASTLEDFLETIGFVGTEADHDAGLASGDDDEASDDSGFPDDPDMPMAVPATGRIAQANGTDSPGDTTAEDASGESEPRPSATPPDVAGPSNSPPGGERIIEGALREAELQRGIGAGEESAAAAARSAGNSAAAGGIPQIERAEGSHALFGRSDSRSDEPGQTTDGDLGAAPEQELEWLRAAAGDDAAVAGPSDAVMRAVYTKYVTVYRRVAVAERAVEAEAEDGVGLHFRACGHAIHAKCLEGYFQSLYQSSMQRELFEGAHIVNLDAGEFLCPVCRRLANAALPMLPAAPSTAPPTSSPAATPGRVSESASAAGEVPPGAQNNASSSTGVQATPEPPREAPGSDPSSQAGDPSGECTAGTRIPEYIRPAVKLILDAEIRTDPQAPNGKHANYWEVGRNWAPIGAGARAALESFAARVARLSGRTRPTHWLELWEALGFTVQATELATRRVSGSPGKGAGISDSLERSVGAEGVAPDKGKRAVTGAGASGPEEGPQVDLAPSDVTDYVSKRLEALAASAGDEGRSVLRPLARAASALRGASIPEQLFRARGLEILAGALLRGRSRDELPSELTAGHSDRTAAESRFWRLLADPVLFHDPFSTLVRLLYVLKGELPDAEGMKALIRLLHLVLLRASAARPPTSPNQETSVPAERTLRLLRTSLPFLRQSALLLEALHPGSVPSFRSPAAAAADAAARSGASRTRIVAPPEAVADVIGAAAGHLEALVLATDLGLAPLEQIMAELDAAERADVAAPARTWQRHFQAEVGGWRGVQTYRGEMDARPFELMRLPRNYHELFQRYVKAKCRLCKTVPVQPVLCLVCGAFLCGHSRGACCRVDNRGECYRHASECGVGVGVFLFLRRTTVTLLRTGRQTVWLSPYLDAHGEEDIDLRRGKPLFLSEERYRALTEMVASMGMDHDSQVLARTVRRLPQAIE